METSVGQFVTSKDGTKIWADHTGDPSKPAVVFIPGLSCSALAFEKQWADQEMLANLHLVRYDIRGQGQSDKPTVAEAYISIRYAEDFKAVCDAFNLNKPFLAGWSMGGIVPADLASAYGGDFLSGVILLGSFPYKSIHPSLAHAHILSLLGPFCEEDLKTWYRTVADFVDSCTAHPERMPALTRFAWMGAVAQQHPSIRVHLLNRTQNEAKLLEVRDKLPYLVIQGMQDLHVVPEKLESVMRKTFSNVEFCWLEDCGHAPFYERPVETDKVILNFVTKGTAL